MRASLIIICIVVIILALLLTFYLTRKKKGEGYEVFSSAGEIVPRTERWMEDLWSYISECSLKDIIVPGSHDTLTYDISGIPAAYDTMSPILQDLQKTLKGFTSSIFINLAKTHTLNLREQFEAGTRCFDLRMSYTDGDWYAVHTTRTYTPMSVFLHELSDTLKDYPYEVVVLWVSLHGFGSNPDSSKFGAIPAEYRNTGWPMFKEILGSHLIDNSQYPIATTALKELKEIGRQIYVSVDGWREMTNSDPIVIPNDKVTNYVPTRSNVADISGTNARFVNSFEKIYDTDYVGIGLNTSNDGGTVADAVIFTILGNGGIGPAGKAMAEKCASGMDSLISKYGYCPETILGWSQLGQYYLQFPMMDLLSPEYVESLNVPSSVLADAIVPGGQLRVGWLPDDRDYPGVYDVDGLLCYPKCREGFHAFGCCVCSPDCPSGLPR